MKAKVCEPRSDIGDLVVVAEFEVWPEPKALTPSALRELMRRFEGSHGAARIIGASEAFVRQNSNGRRVRGKTPKSHARYRD